MTTRFVLIVAAAIANFALGAAVLSRAPRNVVHRYFALFSWSVAIWTLSNGFALEVPWRDIWPRLAFAAASVIPLAFLLLASVFPTSTPSPPKIALRTFIVAGVGVFSASFTSLIVRETTIVDGALQLAYGPLHLPFGVYFVSCLGFSLVFLLRKLRVLTGSQRLQLRYLLLGVSIAAAGATVSNLLIPLLFHTSGFSGYGPLFSIFMIGMIGHTIIRHRLLDIRVVIRRGVVYTCSMVVVALCFFILVEGLHGVFGLGHDRIPLSEALIVALLVAISFQPLKGWMQDLLNAYLYRNTYDYRKTVTEASRRLSTMLDLQPLVEYLDEVIARTFQVEAIRVYLADQSDRSLLLRLPRKGQEERLPVAVSALSQASPLVRFIQSRKEMLVREDAFTQQGNVSLQAAARELADLSGEVALPLFHQRKVIGIVVIGAKRSGDPFFSDDLDLLSTLIGQAAIAMNNAQLYQQVLLANEYVENILRTMDSGVITVDASGRVALCNSTAARLTALSRERLMSLNVSQLPMSLGTHLEETLADGRPRAQIELTLPAQGDRRIPLVCSTSALRDDRGHILGALIVFSDLSKIKELESEKRRAERLASFGAVVSGIAHEIKNPLVAIKTFAELLPERYSDADFRDDFSKVVTTEIDRIDGLVGRLRGLAAPKPDTLAPLDLREPISDTLSLLRGQLEQTQTVVDRDLGSSKAIVEIDPSQAKQLFLNLFLNAIEAMRPGGRLAVRILRSHREGQAWIQVVVSDTGPGIPDAVRAKIFQPFFSTKTRGSGLGLAICRSITDAHRGTIRVEAVTPGAGTTLVVEFPTATVEDQIEEQSIASVASRSR